MATPEEITVHGQRLVNFGSCSYLGLETDPRMKAAVREAVDRYGTQYSSSRTYTSAPLLLQALRSARRHGARRVRYGMSAGLHKARFGARREQRWAYVQPTETYKGELLAHLAESALTT